MNSTTRNDAQVLMFASPRPVLPAAPTADIAGCVHGIHVDRAGRELDADVVAVVQPRIVGVEPGLPAHPVLARLFGEQVLLLEPHCPGKPPRALAHQHHVVGVVHHGLGHERRRGNAFDARHRASAPGWPVHAGGVELHDPFLIGQPAQPDRLILRIELLDVDPGNGGVERVLTGHHPVVGHLDATKAVG
jgi:hypothetical protein